jgi:chaperonin GroES
LKAPFQPTADYILIKPIQPGKTAGGIALPDGADVNPPKGVVVATGPGRVSEYWVLIHNSVKAGDVVYLTFACRDVGQVEIDREKYLIVRSRDVVGAIEPPTQNAQNDDCTQACCARPEPAMAL